MKNSHFFVSRQNPLSQDCCHQVEVAQGGLDYAGANLLCVNDRYRKLGEGETFVGLSKAIKAAFAIAREWKADAGFEIDIAYGNTHGMFTELVGDPLSDELEKILLKVAEEFDSSLPLCARCGEIIEESYRIDGADDERFCCAFCAEEYLRENCEHESEEEEGEGD